MFGPLVVFFVAALVLAVPVPASAYIGPGAGFALLSSFFVLLMTIAGVVASCCPGPSGAAGGRCAGPNRRGRPLGG